MTGYKVQCVHYKDSASKAAARPSGNLTSVANIQVKS